MFTSKVGALALAAVLPLTAAAVVPAVAQATVAPATSKITANVSDSTPASGKAFTVSGKFTVGGDAAGNHVVKVQRQVNGSWSPVTGARMNTAANGTYKLRLILSTTGKRELRVVGVGQGNETNAAQKFSVTVH